VRASNVSAENEVTTNVVTEEQVKSPEFVATLDDEERQQRVEAALSELPVEQAEVVTLKIWGALTFAQIAEVTATSPGTVASRYRYAIERLRRTLTQSELI